MAKAAVTDFMSVFKGGARSNRFGISFSSTPVTTIQTGHIHLCKAANIPAYTVGVAEVKYMGRTLKYPGDRVIEDWTVTFVNDKDFDIKHKLEMWSDIAIGLESNMQSLPGVNSGSSVFGEAQLYQYDREGDGNSDLSPIATYTLKNIWPTSVGEIQLSFDNDNQVEEFTVTFAINEFSISTIGAAG